MHESIKQGGGGGYENIAGYTTSLLSDCDELIGLIAECNSVDGPYNKVEASCGAQTGSDLASIQPSDIVNRVEHLALQITDRAATNDAEIEGKIHTLDALADIEGWERSSLRALRVSIDRDRTEIINARNSISPSDAQPGWLSRCVGLGRRLAG
jgi:hypothetical protein